MDVLTDDTLMIPNKFKMVKDITRNRKKTNDITCIRDILFTITFALVVEYLCFLSHNGIM